MGAFGQSLFATPPHIGGVQLNPFSAYHAQALLELDSPLLEGKGTPTRGDVATALIVCGGKRADGLGRVVDAMGSPWQRLRWNLRFLRNNWIQAGNDLVDHIIASTKGPETWDAIGAGGGKDAITGADWPFYVVSIMAQNFPTMDYEALWDMPLQELFCHKVILAEVNGQVEIADRELRLLRGAKEEAA
jgi:hypothetical protein